MRQQRLTRRWIVAVVVGVLAMASERAVRAQAIDQDGMAADPILLLNDGVQKELKLSDDQVGKVSAIVQEFIEQRNKGVAEMRQAIKDEGEIRQKRMELTAAAWRRLRGVLSDGQVARLRQLSIRHSGIIAFLNPAILNPAILTPLKVTDEQERELRTICQKAMAERPSLRNFRLAHPDATRELWLAAVEEVDDRAMARLLGVLSQGQRTQWAEMIGPEYRFKVGE